MKRLSSRIANTVRAKLLGDGTPDTGCGLKLFRRELYLDLPFFDHNHRFLPALVQRQGGSVVSVQVNHRPRERGQSNYHVFDRLWVGIADLGEMCIRDRVKPGPVLVQTSVPRMKPPSALASPATKTKATSARSEVRSLFIASPKPC